MSDELQRKRMIEESISYYVNKHKKAKFLLSEKEVVIGDVKTCLGESLFRLPPKIKEAVLLFIDLEPEANWAHECIYVFIKIGSTGYHRETHVEQVNKMWPPEESLYSSLKPLISSPPSVKEADPSDEDVEG